MKLKEVNDAKFVPIIMNETYTLELISALSEVAKLFFIPDHSCEKCLSKMISFDSEMSIYVLTEHPGTVVCLDSL